MSILIPELNQKYGVALFDNSAEMGSGWAAVAGEAPFRFYGIHDLTTSVIWLVNVDMKTLHRRQLLDSPKIRPDHFLRTRLSTLISELGLKSQSLEIQAVHLSTLFEQVMQIAFLDTGLETAPRLALNNGLRQIKLPQLPAIPVSTKIASVEALQTYVTCEIPRQVEGELVSLTFHRSRYAQQILSHDLPFGQWESLPPSELAKSQEHIKQYIESCEQPLLIELDIHHVDQSIGHLVNWGAGSGQIVGNTNGNAIVTLKKRLWMTSFEYLSLKKHMQCTVKNIQRGEAFSLSPITIPVWQKTSLYSYAFQLYSENLWTCLGRELDCSAAQHPMAAWVHSVDRMLCFQKARQIEQDELVTIRNYGYGRIVIEVPKSYIAMIPELALKHKMICSIGIHHNSLRDKKAQDFKNASQQMQIIMQQGKLPFVERLSERMLSDAVNQYQQRKSEPANALEIRL